MKGKEEYLWSKTGTADSEIERLENALQVLRYDAASNAPLVLPAKVVPFRKESSLPSFSTHRVFRRALAFAACAAFVAVLLGVRYQIIPNDNYSEIGSAEALVVPKNYAPFPVDEPVINEVKKPVIGKSSGFTVAKKFEYTKQPSVRKPVKARRVFPVIDSKKIDIQSKKIVRNVEPVKQIVKLTKEEKYAYERLMLALSITSSKFKLVKDKVEGKEEKRAVRENGR